MIGEQRGGVLVVGRYGEEYPIGKSTAGSFDLSPEDVQLMSEHDDLENLCGLALALETAPHEQHPNHQVHERKKPLLRSIG